MAKSAESTVRHLLASLAITFSMLPLVARSQESSMNVMDAYRWQKRVLLIFSPDEMSPAHRDQRQILDAHVDGLAERDMVVWEFVDGKGVMADGTLQPEITPSAFYHNYGVATGSFGVILLGKDGGEKLRAGEPVSAEALFALIDSMPMRRREMQR